MTKTDDRRRGIVGKDAPKTDVHYCQMPPDATAWEVYLCQDGCDTRWQLTPLNAFEQVLYPLIHIGDACPPNGMEWREYNGPVGVEDIARRHADRGDQ